MARNNPAAGGTFLHYSPDLPVQGDSDLSLNGYDTATLAQQTEALLLQLNVREFYLAGHDIRAWVAFALAAQFPNRVKKVALLDAGIPGVTLPEVLPVTSESAWKTWHFAFHLLADLPETLIAGREAIYLDWFLRRKAANPQIFDMAKMQEYLRIFTRPGMLRAGLAFYRAVELSAMQNRAVLQSRTFNDAVAGCQRRSGFNRGYGRSAASVCRQCQRHQDRALRALHS